MRTIVVGATGFVGRHLVPHLAASGNQVTAVARREPDRPVAGAAEHVALDVADEDALTAALAGNDAAYYLVHSMTGANFRARDLELATTFGRAAARAGIGRIVYVGALGDDPGSDHLASRQEVGVALAAAGVPVVELRAAVVIGSASISFEMLRYLTERLPFMVCPRWVRTRLQPIALRDLLTYLERSLTVAPGVYEIGGAEVTTYREMIATYAAVRGLRRRWIVDVPYLTPRLSSYWVDLVTPVDRRVSHALIDSLVTEVVVRDPERTEAAFGITPMPVADAIRDALAEQEDALAHELLDRDDGLADGVYAARVAVPLPPGSGPAAAAELREVGGSYSWYGVALGWRVRVLAGRLLGERFVLLRPPAPTDGPADGPWRRAPRSTGGPWCTTTTTPRAARRGLVRG
ncbi:MAG: NAD(P)H-binding protein [Acidimicrobiia bacterium]